MDVETSKPSMKYIPNMCLKVYYRELTVGRPYFEVPKYRN